nr:uncharacterized protein LOC109181117 [Ipomoea batatas]
MRQKHLGSPLYYPLCSSETSLSTSALAFVDPPALAVDPLPHAPSSFVSDVRVGWPAEIPQTVSLLEGHMPLEAVARRLISPRDLKVLEEGSGLRPAFETLLDSNMRATQIFLEEERRRTAGLSKVLALQDQEHQAQEKAQADEIKRYAEEARPRDSHPGGYG